MINKILEYTVLSCGLESNDKFLFIQMMTAIKYNIVCKEISSINNYVNDLSLS